MAAPYQPNNRLRRLSAVGRSAGSFRVSCSGQVEWGFRTREFVCRNRQYQFLD
jgi:hypothetical protein